MADLIMTDEEQHAKTFLEWDDASLGKAVKKAALTMFDAKGDDALAATAAAVMLICRCVDAGTPGLTVDLEGAHSGDRKLGNWKVVLKQVENGKD